MNRETYTMHSSPEHKFPGCAMPQTSDQHSQEVIEISSECSFSISTQRNIHIVSQPRRERYMPPSPELCQVSRLIWKIKVRAQSISHDQGYSDCHIRISRKVAVDLHRITDDCHKAFKARIGSRHIENQVVILRNIVSTDNRSGDERRENTIVFS